MQEQRVSVLMRPEVIEMQQRSVPEPGPGEVLVRVKAVGVCGSDVHYYRHGRIGDFVVLEPLVLGHEVSGEVVAVGSGVDLDRIGELVSIEPQRTDPWCEQSREGRYNLDPAVEFFATPPYDGAFCEYVVVPSALAFRVPAGMNAEEAALLEPLAVAVATLKRAGVRLGDRVAVSGAGPIGLLITRLVSLSGAAVIAVSDPLPGARERATRYGATEVLDPIESDFAEQSYDIFIDASGVPAAIRAGILALKPGGRAFLVGMGPDDLQVPFAAVQVRELEIHGVFRYANAWPAAIAIASQVDLSGLITDRFGLDEVGAALDRAGERDQVKVMVLPDRQVQQEQGEKA